MVLAVVYCDGDGDVCSSSRGDTSENEAINP